MHDRAEGFVAITRDNGMLEAWVWDTLGLIPRLDVGRPLVELFDEDSRAKAHAMLDRLSMGQDAFDWELNLVLGDRLVLCHLWCVPLLSAEFLVLGAPSCGELHALAARIAEMADPRALAWWEALQATGKLAQSLGESEQALYEALSQTNNELVNLQRALAKSNAELVLAVEQLDAFAHSVSHDLRTPLMHIKGFVDIIIEDYGQRLDADGQQYLQWVSEGAVRMETMIDGVLAYSRLSRSQLALKPTDIESVVRDALIQVGGEALAPGVIEIATPMPWALAQRRYLVQMVANLISNALKFVKPGTAPAVCIRAESLGPSGRRVRLWVEDHGIGIAPEHQERVFGLFGRLHSESEYAGTGVGLSIVRAGAERMGGSAGVLSQVGIGSRFWIELQRAEELGG